MANNLATVAPKLLAQGLKALRSATVMPALVNRDYESEAAKKGTVVSIPIPSAIAQRAVVAAVVPPASVDSIPTEALIPLDQWLEAPFHLTDREILESMDGIIPMQASEAVKSLAEGANAYILSKYKGIYGTAGVAGTTPFVSDTTEATDTRKVLNNQLAPMEPRRMVVDPDAEANALNLRAFQDASFAASADAIRDGQIGRKLGFQWLMDQQVPTHTAGTQTGVPAVTGVEVLGSAVIGMTTAVAEAIDLLEGDIIVFSNHSQTYVVTADLSIGASTTGDILIAPGLQLALAGGETITITATHVVNLGFHRDAFAFASRPLQDAADGLGAIIETMTDPISGLSLRLEISRQHKQTQFSYDMLYGAATVRRELASRLLG